MVVRLNIRGSYRKVPDIFVRYYLNFIKYVPNVHGSLPTINSFKTTAANSLHLRMKKRAGVRNESNIAVEYEDVFAYKLQTTGV